MLITIVANENLEPFFDSVTKINTPIPSPYPFLAPIYCLKSMIHIFRIKLSCAINYTDTRPSLGIFSMTIERYNTKVHLHGHGNRKVGVSFVQQAMANYRDLVFFYFHILL